MFHHPFFVFVVLLTSPILLQIIFFIKVSSLNPLGMPSVYIISAVILSQACSYKKHSWRRSEKQNFVSSPIRLYSLSFHVHLPLPFVVIFILRFFGGRVSR